LLLFTEKGENNGSGCARGEDRLEKKKGRKAFRSMPNYDAKRKQEEKDLLKKEGVQSTSQTQETLWICKRKPISGLPWEESKGKIIAKRMRRREGKRHFWFPEGKLYQEKKSPLEKKAP